MIDRTFDFGEAEAAFEYLASGKHVGKVVLKL
jgi:NADPH:quinone reductase-like Zn-dependent oxidoreductase